MNKPWNKDDNQKKDKFSDLNDEFKDTVKGLGIDEIRQRIANVTLAGVSVKAARSRDQKLQDAKNVVKDLSAPYRDEIKELQLQTEFLYEELETRGADVQAFGS